VISEQEVSEYFHLRLRGFDSRDGPQRPLRDRRLMDHVGEGQDLLLDLGREAKEAHDLGDAGAGDARHAGNARLLVNFPASRKPCHSIALQRSSTTRGVLGSRGGLGFPRLGGAALMIRSADLSEITLLMANFLMTTS